MIAIREEKGTILLFTYVLLAALMIAATSFFGRSIAESRIAERQLQATQAVQLAEAGIEQAFFELKQDFINDPNGPSWADGDINGRSCSFSTTAFYTLFDSLPFGQGNYSVQLKNVTGKTDEIWIRAKGKVGDIEKWIEAYVRSLDVSPLNCAIFAGIGSAGAVINGNVDIRGSVLILGEGLTPSDLAIDMSGTATIGNNYEGLPVAFQARMPACSTVIYNGESVESLDAFLRIRRGRAGLSGTATAGEPDFSGNAYKETLNAVYVTDGYGGNAGAANVYSDNGSQNPYDLGESVRFPSLSDPYGGYATYQDYLRDNALVITDPGELNQIAHMDPNSHFNYHNARGSISMDGNGNLNISGIVYIEGGDLNMDKHGAEKIITYTGSGSILVTGDVAINVNLLTQGNNSYPTNIIGIMTPQMITFDEANIDVMGVFYAEEMIRAEKQTNVAGSFVSNYFDMGMNVPSIFQVPDAALNLPPGMIGSEPQWFMKVISWKKL